MRGYRDQGCKQLTHCLSGRRKETMGNTWPQPEDPVPPRDSSVGAEHGPTLCGAQRKWGHTT